MIWSRMRNPFLKNESDENRFLFQKQRKSLLRKARKEYFSSFEYNQSSRQKNFLEKQTK